MTDTKELFAACTPNSLPDAEGRVEHGFQINVMDDDMAILATIDLPDWETFRPASAGHRLIEHGYMIHPEARGQEGTINGWRPVSLAFMVPVIRTGVDDQAPEPITEDQLTAEGNALFTPPEGSDDL